MATPVTAAAARAEREIVEYFRRLGATTPATQKAPPALSPVGERRLRRLVDAHVLREADAGFYLDEAMYASYRADRRAAVVGAIAAVIALVIAVILAQRAQF